MRLNLNSGARGGLTVTNAVIGNTAVGGTQQDGGTGKGFSSVHLFRNWILVQRKLIKFFFLAAFGSQEKEVYLVYRVIRYWVLGVRGAKGIKKISFKK